MNPYDRMLGRIHAMTAAIERRSPRKERSKKKHHEAAEPAHHEAKRPRKKPRRAAKHRKARHR